DFDRDGWLDIVVANYLEYDPTRVCDLAVRCRDYCPPRTFNGQVTKLFRNLGSTGAGGTNSVQFQDVTMTSGLGKIPGFGLGVVCADFNGDGWPDIFVANDENPNHLWINQKDGAFKEEATQRGLAFNGLGQA